MLGPGTSITHAAIQVLAGSGCTVLWCGEESVRFYACGMGETRSSRNLERQVLLYADPAQRLRVVHRMYEARFPGEDLSGLSLQEVRGREGVRVREAYARASEESGIDWKGRTYDSKAWSKADPVNRALSAANSCLYGVCHAAITSLGYSPALGFIHTGKLLSFVYDVADLYKAGTSIRAAFWAAQDEGGIESRVRQRMRDLFRETRLLDRVADDLGTILALDTAHTTPGLEMDTDAARPGELWDPAACGSDRW
jgi:CRISPR-associated protein Cas1